MKNLFIFSYFQRLTIVLLFLVLWSCKKTEDTQVPANEDITKAHLLLGNPSNAQANVSMPENYLLERPQFALSYSKSRAIPNWVSWHLSKAWIGSSDRQDDFRPDENLPTDWYAVRTSHYTGSGFDRGHNCPSADRTATVADNSATFLMTNIMPQSPDHNQGVWARLEDYCRTQVEKGNELYIICGSYGSGGTGSNGFASTISEGRIAVPANIWKVIVILPEGKDDLNRITSSTRVIAVNIPNKQGVRNDNWGDYRLSVDDIERRTGLDLLSKVSQSVQNGLESKVDQGGTQ